MTGLEIVGATLIGVAVTRLYIAAVNRLYTAAEARWRRRRLAPVDPNAWSALRDTFEDVEDEALSAHAKHGERSFIAFNSSDVYKPEALAALGEEFGEVCRELTYDNGGSPARLRKELVQLAHLSTVMASKLPREA